MATDEQIIDGRRQIGRDSSLHADARLPTRCIPPTRSDGVDGRRDVGQWCAEGAALIRVEHGCGKGPSDDLLPTMMSVEQQCSLERCQNDPISEGPCAATN